MKVYKGASIDDFLQFFTAGRYRDAVSSLISVVQQNKSLACIAVNDWRRQVAACLRSLATPLDKERGTATVTAPLTEAELQRVCVPMLKLLRFVPSKLRNSLWADILLRPLLGIANSKAEVYTSLLKATGEI